ncbi:hypothetical protein N7474_011047 [Penicillium riverlandense]|uniref:uncharacterized protein n=1 Tax=Penicillium riverlandense TaxID=1903569 RepID=UPI002548C71F|nr:uncharacterized protein N7474_011047 [Penicillium riverlandense]KAJ5805160.1 hypothetical protein N7474_011047 [Penicillium riverlandense]
MKLLGNIPGVLCTLLALAPVGFSLPRAKVLDVTAEDFMRMKQIKVRADGTSVNNTGIGTEHSICGPCSSNIGYSLVGDGDPHQNFVITQKGNSVIACDTSGSSTSTGFSNTLGWSFSLGANTQFDSLGFSVSESETYSTSNSFNCNGVADEGGEICVLFYQAVTAFTVSVERVQQCGCEVAPPTEDLGQAIIYAPNANQVGSVIGRGINVPAHGVEQCFGNSDRTILYYCGPPGGPEWWTGRGDGPWIDDYVNQRVPTDCPIPIEANLYLD